MSDRAEENIIGRCAHGDRQAFNELVALHSGRLYSFLRTVLHDHAAADVVLQETFVRAYLSIGKFEPGNTFSHWLFRIAFRLSLSYLKTESRRKTREHNYEAENARPGARNNAVERVVLKDESSREIFGAVQALSPKQKAAISLFAFENCSIKEIAGVMDCSQGAVMSHLHRARQALREALGNDYMKDAFSGGE